MENNFKEFTLFRRYILWGDRVMKGHQPFMAVS